MQCHVMTSCDLIMIFDFQFDLNYTYSTLLHEIEIKLKVQSMVFRSARCFITSEM